ncbi:MAG: glycosyltransferase family 87 protein [Hyphomonadaceae bacterium]
MLDRLLTPARLSAYPKIVLIMFAAVLAGWTALSLPDLIDPMDKPIGYDFIAFWSGARVALEGAPASAYDIQSILAAHRQAVPSLDTFYLWHYPPTYMLAVLPLGLMPYLAALVIFLGLTIAAWRLVVLRVVTDARGLWAAAALPAGLICVIHGQNGFLIAALIGGALLFLDKRPLLAGALIGCLAIKPHLAILFPIALAASGRWRAFASAAVTLALLVVAATLAFGVETWRAFFENLPAVRHYVDSGFLPWGMMPTPYVLARSLSLSPDIAMALQIASALAAGICVFLAWRGKDAPFEARAAVFCAATLLISPYLFYYDLTILGLSAAWLAMLGLKEGFLPYERPALLAAWAAPILMVPFYALAGLQLGVFVTLGALYFAMKRALAAPISQSAPTLQSA